jgi:hypothetical protein
MNTEKVGTRLLSDDELDPIAGGRCYTTETIPCPIGKLEIRTPNCPGDSGGKVVVYIPPSS